VLLKGVLEMKFAFSTLGCPGWSWQDVLSAASDMGFDGIELRGIGSELYLPRSKQFAAENLPGIRERLAKLGLEVPCLTTGAFLFDPAVRVDAGAEVRDYLALASGLGVPYIRVLADANPESGPVDQVLLEENLQEMLPLALEAGVTLLIESNGIFANSSRLAALLEKINHQSLGVLWDIHHPYRYFHESVEATYRNLKPWLRHVHIKDSVVRDGRIVYRMFGHGDVPVVAAVELLAREGYAGYVVLEWVKRWCMDLEDPGIVLPHYLYAIKNMLPR